MKRVAFFQQQVLRKNKAENLKKIVKVLKQAVVDILVLPELCTTGYLYESKAEALAYAEAIPGGPTTNSLIEIAKTYSCAIVAGVAEEENGELFNSVVVVDRNGYVGKYRKIHLTRYEKKFFSRGHERPVFNVAGIRLGVQVCYDLWFPEMSRELVLQGADLLCVLANFGAATTQEIARVRALENRTALVLCNRIGFEQEADMDAEFIGKSLIVNPDGQMLAEGEEQKEIAKVVDLEINRARFKESLLCDDLLEEIKLHQ